MDPHLHQQSNEHLYGKVVGSLKLFQILHSEKAATNYIHECIRKVYSLDPKAKQLLLQSYSTVILHY